MADGELGTAETLTALRTREHVEASNFVLSSRAFPPTPWAKLERNEVGEKGTGLVSGKLTLPKHTKVLGDKTAEDTPSLVRR